MKRVYVGLLIILVGIISQSAVANTFATVSSYVPSWQTVKGSIPPAAYWPGIAASSAAFLGMHPSFGQYVIMPYVAPYLGPYALILIRRFMVERGYTLNDLRRPEVAAECDAYMQTRAQDPHTIKNTLAYYFGLPVALLLGGHLYQTYR